MARLVEVLTPRITLEGTPVIINGALAAAGEGGESRTMLAEAKDFLREELVAGPRPVQELKTAAAAAGLAWRTIRRAQAELGIKPDKLGLDGCWQWHLP